MPMDSRGLSTKLIHYPCDIYRAQKAYGSPKIGVDTSKGNCYKRQHVMKITVSMDARGRIMVKNARGEMLEECFFKTDDETEEELRAWGYRRLVYAYRT